MVEFGYPDVEVFDEVVSGFKLAGNTPLDFNLSARIQAIQAKQS